MLKKLRQIAATAFFLLTTLLFLDFTGTVHLWLGWLAKVQLVPAILAANAVAIAVPVVLTLLFGRIYCSVACPLGVLQDGISRVAGKRKGRKNRFRFSPAKSWLRYGALALFVAAAAAAGVSVCVSVLDPYAAYGRIASNLFSPLYRLGNNLLAWLAERADSYAFYSADVWMKGWAALGIAGATLVAVGVLAWRGGRTYCNTVCPVGTALGLLARFSIFRLTIDAEKCKRCNLCERGCKASCISAKSLTIDRSRCVACFSCVEQCKFGAMKYAPVEIGRKNAPQSRVASEAAGASGVSRRSFVSIAGILALSQAVKSQQLKVDGGLAEIKGKKAPERKTPIAPPGAVSLRNMGKRCTACQLCVSVCPNGVLRPSTKLATLMQPEVSYERGYCRPECTKCSEVCPTGAIAKITPAEKSAISVGKAVWVEDSCIVNRDNVQCSRCAESCPVGAITLVAIDPESKKSLKLPAIDGSQCIGCGACENLCAARPLSAVYVEGNVVHHTI
jgi:polyferredoxin